MRLTPKHQLFIKEYLVDLSATEAAKRAGYKGKFLPTAGYKLLQKPEIADAIAKEMETRAKRIEVNQDMVLKELALIGFSDMKEYAKWAGSNVKVIDSDSLSKDASRAISEITQTTTLKSEYMKFKLHDKVGALELIGKHLGMFKEKVELSNSKDEPFTVQIVKHDGND